MKNIILLLDHNYRHKIKDMSAANARVLFFSRKYDRFLELKKTLPQKDNLVEIGASINHFASRIRRPYLDHVGEINSRKASMSWWLTGIAEKNTMSSPVFLYVCYLLVLKEYLESHAENSDLYVISESQALLETIKASSKMLGSNTYISCFKKKNHLKGYLTGAKRIVSFLARTLFQMAGAALASNRRHPDLFGGEPLTIIRTWVSDQNMNKDGSFKDSYFPGLAEWLRSKGEKVVTLPILYNVKRTFFSSFRWFSGSKYGFLITQNYYTFSDLIGAIRVMKNSKWPKEERSIFCGYDLSLIFEEESSRVRFDVGALELLMHYYILKRLKNLGVNIRKMIITFENMFPEKPVIAGMREFYPEAEVVGFQHSVLFPLLLSLYTSCNERSVLPVPDKIVCSGRSFMKILEAEGYPREVLFEGPALRFQHLLSAEPAPCCQSKNKKAVLIALPLGQDSALELLFKSKEALDSMARSFEIIVKPHPMMGSQELKDLFNKALIDMNRYKLSDLPMGQLLSKTDVMITIASGAVYDAIASRICVIRVRRETEINLDPLDWFADNFGFVAQGPADIRDLLIRIFDMEEQESSDMLDKGVSLIKDCFSRVTEETMSAFLSGKKVVS